MKKQALMILPLLLSGLAACTPADEQYCQRFGVGGTAEFGKCINYFHAQDAAFGADYEQCAYDADATYPRSLYDTGRTVNFGGGFWGGRYFGGGTQFIEPDYYHNNQVDALRDRIIEPCMQAQGWNSSRSWQAGTHPVTMRARPKQTGQRKLIPQPEVPLNSNSSALPWIALPPQ